MATFELSDVITLSGSNQLAKPFGQQTGVSYKQPVDMDGLTSEDIEDIVRDRLKVLNDQRLAKEYGLDKPSRVADWKDEHGHNPSKTELETMCCTATENKKAKLRDFLKSPHAILATTLLETAPKEDATVRELKRYIASGESPEVAAQKIVSDLLRKAGLKV